MADALQFLDALPFEARALEGLGILAREGQNVIALCAEHLADDARALCPVSPGVAEDVPGELLASIAVEPQINSSGAFEIDVVAGAPYAVFVEFGTFKMPAEPFMRPAMLAAEL